MVAEADALRSAPYLKRVYGVLTNVQEAVSNRANVAARANPANLTEQVGYAMG